MRSSVMSEYDPLRTSAQSLSAIVPAGKRLTRNENPDSMPLMKTKTIGLTLAFCLLGWAVCFAADPQMGTWNLNEAKSKITPGTTKFTTVAFKNMFGNVKVTSDGVDANGKPIHVEWS